MPAFIFTSRYSALAVTHFRLDTFDVQFVNVFTYAYVRFVLQRLTDWLLLCFQFTFECECPPGFTGQKCETEIDFCANVTCENGATCYSLTSLETFECSCVEGVCF